MNSQARFLQGAFEFEGHGLSSPSALGGEGLSYTVPSDRRAQLVYFRGGNSSEELVYVVLRKDGEAIRLFPMGAKEAVHVPLRVVEDLDADASVDLQLAAPEGVFGTVVIDIGMVES